MFKTSLLLPTARDRYKEVMRSWDGPDIEFILSYELRNPDLKRLTENEKKDFQASIREEEHNTGEMGISQIWNKMAELSNSQCIGIIADDLFNITPNWQELILRDLPTFECRPWVVVGNDAMDGNDINTCFAGHMAAHPFMSKQYYDLFGYIWYPEYLAYGCDNELYHVGMGIGRLHYLSDFRQENRHAGSWENVERDRWSNDIQKSGKRGVEILQQGNRIVDIINETKNKIKELYGE